MRVDIIKLKVEMTAAYLNINLPSEHLKNSDKRYKIMRHGNFTMYKFIFNELFSGW